MILDSITTGLKNIIANRMRSFLSILGIVFGTAALVATMSIGEGTKRQIVSAVEAMGSNLIVIESQRGPVFRRRAAHGLRLKDVRQLQKRSPLVKAAAPIQWIPTGASYGGKFYPVIVQGTTANLAEINKLDVERGRFLTSKDIDERAKVCVLGSKIKENISPRAPLVGKFIEINRSSFLIVGELKKKGYGAGKGINPDVTIFIPITVSRELGESDQNLTYIFAQGVSPELIDETKEEITRLLDGFHDGHGSFKLWAQEELLRKRREISEAFRWALGSIAIVCLIIAGIGIMNILLAGVNERIKEIGIRKAVGASPADIMQQFLFESLLLTVAGGLIGIGVGILMSQRISDLLVRFLPQKEFHWVAVITPGWMLVAFCFALMTGILFGIYPALKASRLDPCEALMYE